MKRIEYIGQALDALEQSFGTKVRIAASDLADEDGVDIVTSAQGGPNGETLRLQVQAMFRVMKAVAVVRSYSGDPRWPGLLARVAGKPITEIQMMLGDEPDEGIVMHEDQQTLF